MRAITVVLSVSALIFTLWIVFFGDIPSFEKVKQLSYNWIAFVVVVLMFFWRFFLCLKKKITKCAFFSIRTISVATLFEDCFPLKSWQ